MQSLKELRERAQEANHAVWELERAEHDEKNKALIGKTFRYRNSYGVAHPGDWWLYSKVLRVKDGGLVVFRFQETSMGEIKIEPEADEYHTLNDGHKPIPPAQFDGAWAALLTKIKSL